MTIFSVEISSQPASGAYKQDSLVSFSGAGACIHIASNDLHPMRSLQKAARKIANVASKSIGFVGSWSLLQQQVFVQSYCGPDFDGEFSWANNHNELDNYLSALLFTKDLTNSTPEQLSPQELADSAEKWLSDLAGDDITVRKIVGEELKQAGWMGIYEVGRGSDRPPVLLELDYNPNNQESVDFALVGKGITFDSGGYSIKSSEGMLDMKCDMGGAAMVTGALGLAIMMGLKKRVKLYLCCAENLISGHAYKLGDIIKYKNGTTVEVVNTDAEGRLVLADGLLAACADGARTIIDAATLTGAAVVALDREYNAVFSVDDELANNYLQLGQQQSEAHWRLPLESWHSEQCPSPFADTANSRPQKGGGGGGASNAAGFLARFVDTQNCQWVHVDIAAAYSRNATSTAPAGASGIGLRTIAAALLQ